MGAHYFDPQPHSRSERRSVTARIAGREMSIATDHGVFGYGVLDRGTRHLLASAPAPPPAGHLADLGCGTGAIALALAARSPAATVWAIDVNERALELCAHNARANGLDNVRAVPPDAVPGEVRFATIWSNPPIRVGKAVLHDLLRTWLTRLEADAHAYLVVHRHLGSDSLQRWLSAELGLPTTRRSSHDGYRILDVHAAPAGPGEHAESP